MIATLFRAYTRWRLRRDLDGVWVAGLDELRDELARGAVVLAATHGSWWDGLVLIELDRALGRSTRVLMDAANLAAAPYLARVGALPLDRSSPARMRAGLRLGLDWLEAPGRGLWVFPQGRQRPHHLRPLGLQRGFELLASRTEGKVVPVALGYGFREASVPAAVVVFGAPVPAAELEPALEQGLAQVDAFLDRGAGPFTALVPSRHLRTDRGLGARALARLVGPPPGPPPRRRAVVVGAGLGGLAAAIRLAARGWVVEVVEAHGSAGGKAGTAEVDGVVFDTGPSVLTLPEVFDATFRDAGSRLADVVELVSPSPAFRYHWPDGVTLDVEVDPGRTLDQVGAALGPAARDQLARFLTTAARIWDAAAPRFVFGPAPRVGALLSLSALRDVAAIDPLRRMGRAIDAQVTEPHLRDVLRRYATYNGSDPRVAPATLNCIAHVELALGGYGVRGGVSALVRALVAAADRLGVRFRFGEGVERIDVEGGSVRGVTTARGRIPADVVVSNAEAAHTLGALVPGGPGAPVPTSTSGWTAVARAAPRPRAAHTVWFPPDYAEEFVDLFDRDRVPATPTVYACAGAVAHDAPRWPGHEPLFVMVNAPPDVPRATRTDWDVLEAEVRAGLVARGALAPDDTFVWRRAPHELAARFPGSRGALYGAASNGPGAAFRRPANRVRGIRGLYLAGGSAHPGGGMPLCVASGRAAADAAVEDT